ncbi:MAG: GNAT family N-acetyltransferase [Firmicutes bacterium]|nr:GNAT family N-acetyltransferase [Bacillota bacterium]
MTILQPRSKKAPIEQTIEHFAADLDDYRGLGYGALLIEWAINRFASHGIHDIDVKVADGNEAVSFYEKYGFKMNAHILRLSSSAEVKHEFI